MGVLGLVVSPDVSDVVLGDPELDAIRVDMNAATSGTKRGSTVVMRGQTKVQQIKTDLKRCGTWTDSQYLGRAGYCGHRIASRRYRLWGRP